MTSVCREAEPCIQSACEALEELQNLTPRGPIWSLDDNRVLSRFFCAIAEVKSCVTEGICQEWAEADACTSSRTLARWAAIWCFPSDCVPLTSEKLCAWIELVLSCERGSEGFFFGILELAEVDATGLTIEVQNCCENIFSGCPCVTISGDFDLFTVEKFNCDWTFFERLKRAGGFVHIPEIECLRKHLPVGLKIKYEPDCDPDFIRQIKSGC